MNKNIIFACILIVLISSASYIVYTTSQSSSDRSGMTDKETTMPNENTPQIETETTTDESNKIYSGQQIAGTVSPYIIFNNQDYKQALAEGKTVFLEFYASWCPVCRGEAPDIEAGFDQLNDPNIVGFRVNYNDPDTDETEKALAQEYGVTYQHTKVLIKNGEVVLKNGEVWDTERFLNEIKSN
ncbi:MAG: thioredoxin domain-containing protein [Weeksellaceae bacterium]